MLMHKFDVQQRPLARLTAVFIPEEGTQHLYSLRRIGGTQGLPSRKLQLLFAISKIQFELYSCFKVFWNKNLR